jgi:hypothetical protein
MKYKRTHHQTDCFIFIFSESVRDTNIMAVIIHRSDKLRTDVNIYNPVVRIHLLDLDLDGQYVKKTRRLLC